MKTKLLFAFIILGCVLPGYSQTENPYDLFEKDVMNPNNNMVFTDVAFLHKPFYVVGYERKLNKIYALSAGIMLLQDEKPYKFLTGIDFFEDYETFYKAPSKLNFFFYATYYANTRKSNFQNYFSLGYHLIHLEKENINDIFIKKSIVCYEWKNRIHLALSAEFGFRYFKKLNPTYSFFHQKIVKGQGIFYVHLPVNIGLRF